jgi:hypothetical protein
MMLVGPSGSGKGNAVEQFKRLTRKKNFRHLGFRLNQSDCNISYSTLRKLFLQLVGPTNFITEENQQDVVAHLFADCYPDDDLPDTFRKHFPMLKFVLNLEWDHEDVYVGNVARAYEFIGDPTFQEILLFLFKKSITTLVIEDVNFCDELSWRELLAVLDSKAPLLMLFTGSDTQEAKRIVSLKKHKHNSGDMSSLGSTLPAAAPTVGSPPKRSDLPQVAVSTPTSKQTKVSVYGGLSEMDGTYREPKPDRGAGETIAESCVGSSSSVAATASVLFKKESKDFSCIRKHDNCTYMPMPLLGEEEVADILKSTLDVTSLPPTLPLEVLELCNGSVYWCMSVANYIKAIGIDNFHEESITTDSTEPTQAVFPEVKKSKTAKRLERHLVYHLESFSVKLQTIAKYASVIGDEFLLAVLFRVLPAKVCVSLHDLGKCLDRLSSEGVMDLIDDTANIYSFQNDLIRKTLMDYVLPSDADKIHHNVACALEALFSDNLRPHYSSLSYHYAMSPVSERGSAFKYTLKAADQQIGNGDFHAGYLYLEYAASFVKYDSEMIILSQVTDTALFDLKKQKKAQGSKGFTVVAGDTTVLDEDVINYENMSKQFEIATSQAWLNGATILRSGSCELAPISGHTSLPSLQKSADSGSGSEHDSLQTSPKHEQKIIRTNSAGKAKLLKMPSYSAKHPVRANRSWVSKQQESCCSIS